MSELRDWRPGDGITCSFKGRSAFECGAPVKTRVIAYEAVGRKHSSRRQPLCAVHASATEVQGASATVRRQASDRLIVAHWDEYQRYLAEAAAGLAATVDSVERPARACGE